MFKLGITAVTFAPSVLVGQSERLVTPTAHTVESPAEFTRVTAVFELPGGKVVVVDQGEAIIGMVDFASGTKSNVGRHGSGPGEYRLPTLMYPLGGDSVGILDDGNGRLLVIGSDGKTGGFATPRAEWGLAALTGDGRGYLYAEGSASRRSPGGALVISDSAPLVRWRLGGNVVDTVAFLVRPMPAGAIATASGAVTRPGTVTALQPRQAWAVSRAGTTAVVSHDPYQVSLVRSSGDVVRGPTIPYEKAPITDSVKRAFVADVTEPTASVVVDEHGKVQISRGRAPFTRIPSAWASHVPPFRPGGMVAFDSRGTLWIQRVTFGMEGGRYDLVDSTGRRFDSVRLQSGLRVVGFGREVMYVVRRDHDDLEHLQRVPLPY